MSDLPELVVDGPVLSLDPVHGGEMPERHTVRIDALPTVTKWIGTDFDVEWKRPLRAGDRVTLAAMCADCPGVPTHWHTFATATVADTICIYGQPDDHWVVTVTDVTTLERNP